MHFDSQVPYQSYVCIQKAEYGQAHMRTDEKTSNEPLIIIYKNDQTQHKSGYEIKMYFDNGKDKS